MQDVDVLGMVGKIRENISRVMVGKDAAVNLLLIALLSRGHVLLEDVPGIGKTTLVNAMARSLACSFARIQFTPDVMPSDITGLSVYNMKTREFEFRPGPVFHQILLADEINRTSPKTQSSLLEIMQEQQVTVDGITYASPKPFMVLATQNPIEHAGTFPLPDAQLDRFCMSIQMGYPSPEEEVNILHRNEKQNQTADIVPVASVEDILFLQDRTEKVVCVDPIKRYISSFAQESRKHPDVLMGISPRASIHLMNAAKALAMMEGRNYVIPQDVKRLVLPVLSHRLVLRSDAGSARRTTGVILGEMLKSIPVPK
ncbi:MAG: MoxR family ATPase [Clostridiaceae bacterium]|nr:MoxR family ATPase [Oscillospiraceae bacterium]NLO62920.1 MoxR family ATPase [Clostridiaceae bacterium]